MHTYQTAADRAKSLRPIIRILIIILVFALILVVGGMALVHRFEDAQITVLNESFSHASIMTMEGKYGISITDDVTPLYTFQQGQQENKTYYTGILFQINSNVNDVLENCCKLHEDSAEHKTIENNCRDYFEENDYDGYTETVYTRDGKEKAISFSIPDSPYRYFIFKTDAGYQLMARREHNGKG